MELRLRPDLVDELVILLDDGDAVTLTAKGTQRCAPGQRVRILSDAYGPPRIEHEQAHFVRNRAHQSRNALDMRRDQNECVVQLSPNRKETIMKRIIAAVSFAVLAVPAFAAAADASAPYEKAQFDRVLPNIESAASAGQADASAGPSSAASGSLATGVWSQDHNFISPAE